MKNYTVRKYTIPDITGDIIYKLFIPPTYSGALEYQLREAAIDFFFKNGPANLPYSDDPLVYPHGYTVTLLSKKTRQLFLLYLI